MRRIVVIGASGHAKVVLDAIERGGEDTVVGLLDDAKPRGSVWFGHRLLGPVTELATYVADVDAIFVAVGDGFVRERIAREIRAAHPGLEHATVVHPSAIVARGVVLGEGTIVTALSVVQADARIGEGVIVNTRASIDHDCVVGDYTSISPGATLGGNVDVGRQVFVGLNASVLHGRRVGDHAVVGAGATVIEDVPPRVVVVGVPARVVRERSPGDRIL